MLKEDTVILLARFLEKPIKLHLENTILIRSYKEKN